MTSTNNQIAKTPSGVVSAGKNFQNSIVQNNPTASSQTNYRPAVEVPQEFITIFDEFNSAFWDGALSDCIFTYTHQTRILGYYSPKSLVRSSGERCAKIALNPVHLALLHPISATSILAHEMAHHWRHTLGPVDSKGNRGSVGYHDKAWGDEMKRIGLFPSNTGCPGGKETGQQVMHYIIPDGPFDQLATRLFESGMRFNWHEAIDAEPANSFDKANPFATGRSRKTKVPKKKQTRAKFTCSVCGLNAWAKPQAALTCTTCAKPLILSEK
ncbi:SprT-like domain-containing protein [Stappia sp. ES.058]|uniref:SprT-like domain-containing protein n=1 Tax=Stappia sp. ES.058 TaxID=1881061 RepID=UPI0008797277|nr:SprT-like domain-containing protein [Stappia sp. ES.058]SDU42531.1 SprT-like family protein [Stappia sp. ES.058]